MLRKHYVLSYLLLLEKVILSISFDLKTLRGCTIVLNLKSFFSFIKTKEAGLEAAIGETILHIPEILRSNISIQTENKTRHTNVESVVYKFVQY